MKKNINILIILFFVTSFLGWLFEVITMSISHNELVTRGAMLLPLCIIYGFGVTIGVLTYIKFDLFSMKKWYKKYSIMFIILFIECFILEFLTGLILDKMFHVQLWSYHSMDNIMGYVSITVLIIFSIVGNLYINTLYKKMYKYLLKIDYRLLLSTNISMSLVIILNYIVKYLGK